MKSPLAVIVDYRTGNLASVGKALGHAGFEAQVTDDPDVLGKADLLVVPGVGNFTAGIETLDDLGLVGPIRDHVSAGRPTLGICLGMQLMFERSDEGDAEGLGIFAGHVVRLSGEVKVPHMGWNEIVKCTEALAPFDQKRFYFVHSYVCRPEEQAIVAAVTEYGDPFPSAVASGKVFGFQFHPEKSSADGLALLGRLREVLF